MAEITLSPRKDYARFGVLVAECGESKVQLVIERAKDEVVWHDTSLGDIEELAGKLTEAVSRYRETSSRRAANFLSHVGLPEETKNG